MFRGRVLVVDGDDMFRKLLALAVEERGFAVDVCAEAREGFQKAFDTIPDCVVCSVDLPDIDGFWFARRVRTEGGAVAKTPIVLLCSEGDKEARVQGLQVGADVVLERPISNAEVALQTDALVSCVRRVRGPEATEEPSAPSLAAAFRGDLSTFPLASILMMLEMERRTGTLEVVASSKERASLVLSAGLFASSDVNGASKPPVDALREVLSWRSGRFAFRPRDVGSLPPPGGSIGALVLEAMRLDDESKAAR